MTVIVRLAKQEVAVASMDDLLVSFLGGVLGLGGSGEIEIFVVFDCVSNAAQ